MKKTFILSLAFVFTLFGFANIFAQETKGLDSRIDFQQQNIIHKKVEIILEDDTDLERIATLGIDLHCGANIMHKKGKRSVTLELSTDEITQLESANFQPKILIEDMADFYEKRAIRELPKAREDLKKAKATTLYKNTEAGHDLGCTEEAFPIPQNFTLGSMAGMKTYQEMLNELDQMRSLYPNLITARAPISTTNTTIEGRDVFYVKLSDNPDVDENEAEVLYTGVHHAREPMSMMNLLYYMWYLLENYATDQEVQNIIDNTELYFIPIVNPDGYLYNESTNPNGGGFWRKNRRNNGGGSFGVDLNRNYDYQWGLNSSGSSSVPTSEIYRGTAPFSEPETQMVRDFVQSHDFVNAFNNHAYSNLMLHPWGFTTSANADEELYDELSEHMCWHNRYHYGNSNEVIYATNGDSDDWFYGAEDILTWTPEIGSGAEGGFWPSPTNIVPQCERQMKMSLILASSASNYGVLNDLVFYDLDVANSTLIFGIEHLSSIDGAFTVSVSSSSPYITAIANPTMSTGTMTQANSMVVFTGVTIDPSTPPGAAITFDVVLNNGTYDIYTTTIQKTYKVPTLISDNGTNLNNWISNGGWGIANAGTPQSSITDSPSGNMSTAVRTLTLSTPLDLSAVQFPVLEYYTKWDIARLYDYVQIEASINGVSWTELCGTYTKPGTSPNNVWSSTSTPTQPTGEGLYDGFQKEWVREQIDLSAYSGISTLYLRFKADGDPDAGQRDGFYFDNFRVYHEPLGHCGNGVQDMDEADVDCGGTACIACPTCSDGIQNGNEVAIDCGGADCEVCPPCTGVTLSLNFDNFADETSWSIVDANGIEVAVGGNYTANDSAIVISDCVPFGCYNFVIEDAYGDGICCGFGNGSYTLVDDATGNILASGGEFDLNETTSFCLNTPTCATVDLDIRFDGFPNQTSWDITDANSLVVASGDGNGATGNSNLIENACLPDGCYTLNFYDAVNNGMCPFLSSATSSATFITPGTLITSGSIVASLGSVISPGLCGSYTLYDTDGTVLVTGGAGFGAAEANTFCLSGGVANFTNDDSEAFYARQNAESSGTISSMEVFPTLTKNEVTVRYSLDNPANAELHIIDINGQIIQQHSQSRNDQQEVKFDVSHLPSGLYFVQLISEESVMVRKFVKQ